jgi:hypothetical protein
MKNIFTYIGIILLILNSFVGLIFSKYAIYNWLSNNVIIIVNTIILSLLSNSKYKDGFKISLSFLLPVIGAVQFIIGAIMQNKIQDNMLLITIFVLFSIQFFLLLIGKIFSKYA